MKKINSYGKVVNKDIGIRVNANESYKNISDYELRDITEEIGNVKFNRYPDDECNELREVYGKVIGVNKENLIVGNGSDEMISLIISSQITRKKVVLTIDPDFSMYDFYTSVSDGVIKKYSTEQNGTFSVNKFINFGEKLSPKLIIFSNPNNPTGHVISNEDILYILDSFKESLVVVDEAYYEFYGQSMISYIEKYKNLVVTRTLSKAWGLAALRVGFLIANKNLIEELSKNKVPYNLNTISQVIATNVLRHPEKILENVEEVVYERERLYKNLKNIEERCSKKIVFYKSKANFIFGRSVIKEEIKRVLDDNGILIRYFKDDSFRITVGSSLENDLVGNVIESAVLSREAVFNENITN